MTSRPLDITVISANGIKDVNKFSKMDVFVVVSVITGYHNKSQSTTPVHKNGGTSPRWNHPIKFVVDENSVHNKAAVGGASFLVFGLVSNRVFGNKPIGEVKISVDELFKDSASGAERIVEYNVISESGKKKGTLKFSYKFGEKFKQQDAREPVTAYPPPPEVAMAKGGPSVPYVPPPGMGYGGMANPTGYPAPTYGGYTQQGYGYGYVYPPQNGYGYPPPHGPGYGYPPMQQPPKKSKFGMGAGLGLGAGLLGGMLVGDMISDMGETAAYDAGYEEAVEDMGGYNF